MRFVDELTTSAQSVSARLVSVDAQSDELTQSSVEKPMWLSR